MKVYSKSRTDFSNTLLTLMEPVTIPCLPTHLCVDVCVCVCAGVRACVCVPVWVCACVRAECLVLWCVVCLFAPEFCLSVLMSCVCCGLSPIDYLLTCYSHLVCAVQWDVPCPGPLPRQHHPGQGQCQVRKNL